MPAASTTYKPPSTGRSWLRGINNMPPSEVVTAALDHDGGREVTVYVPPDDVEAVVFAGDGGWHASRLSDRIEAAGIRSTMIVGVHGMADDDGRLKEYVPGFDEERYGAHENFFV